MFSLCFHIGECDYAHNADVYVNQDMCIDELMNRLYYFEEETEQLNNKLRSNPIISKLMDKMKG